MNFLAQLFRHHFSSIALVAGFVIDSLTLRRVDLLPETLLLYGYLGTAAACIFLLHIFGEKASRIHFWLVVLLQFTFGGLFSAFLIFYSKSAALSTSWPFLLLLCFIFLGTEIFRQYHARFLFQLSVFFFALFSFFIFAVPLAVGAIGWWVFLLSGFATVVTFALFMFILRLTGSSHIRASRLPILITTGCIFILINALYFTNVLPPIPLALQEIGVYHLVTRSGDGYILQAEKRPWYGSFLRPVLHVTPSEPLYVFASVFTPVSIKTEVRHRWQKYDPTTGAWEDSTVVEFPMNGGRDEGYRGFSLKYGLDPGLWRVSVETPGGQKIGEITFRVEAAMEPPELYAVTR